MNALQDRLQKLPEDFLPELVLRGSVPGELWAWSILNGMTVALQGIKGKTGTYRWLPMATIPPKLAHYLEIFLAQHYHLLNNTLGIPFTSALNARTNPPSKAEVTTDRTTGDVTVKPSPSFTVTADGGETNG